MKILLFLFLLLASSSFSQTQGNTYEIHEIESEILSETREVWVGLPENYDSTKAYPVIYVLDAEDRFQLAYTLAKEQFSNQSEIPQTIVVGIPNIDKVRRIYDMTFTESKLFATGEPDSIGYFREEATGNGQAFLSFLENEVVPLVNGYYSTNNFNTLVGHSIGGYFCAYILPIQETFTSLQIYDPSIWYNSGDAIRQIEKNLQPNDRKHVFIAKGTAFDGPRKYVDNHLLMIDSLRTFLEGYPNLNVSGATYNKDHNAMVMYAILDGLPWLLKDVEYGFISEFKEITLQGYQAFYQAASERLGAQFDPPVDGIRWVAYANHYQENWDEALKAYELCYSVYEQDIMVNQEMAKCYEELGNKKKAKYHQKKVEALMAE